MKQRRYTAGVWKFFIQIYRKNEVLNTYTCVMYVLDGDAGCYVRHKLLGMSGSKTGFCDSVDGLNGSKVLSLSRVFYNHLIIFFQWIFLHRR